MGLEVLTQCKRGPAGKARPVNVTWIQYGFLCTLHSQPHILWTSQGLAKLLLLWRGQGIALAVPFSPEQGAQGEKMVILMHMQLRTRKYREGGGNPAS